MRAWLVRGPDSLLADRRRTECDGERCALVAAAPSRPYAYLLGQYLGDGYIAAHPRGVYRLVITACDWYPKIIAECADAIRLVMPRNTVEFNGGEGCIRVSSYSKHWPCLFPQHGPGRKHERPIELARWQQAVVNDDPRAFIRGLLHSDGCRVMNRVHVRGRWYAYPRYFFSNESDDIRMLFGDACDLVGVEWRHNRRNSISVARRRSVALLDEFVGPKS